MSGKLSAREKMRAINFGSLDGNVEAPEQKNVVTDLLDNLNAHEEEINPAEEKRDIEKEIDDIAKTLPEPEITKEEPIKSEPKKAGRPPVYKEELQTVTIRLTKANYEFVLKHGWEYRGYTGYINHLIEEKRGME